MPNNNNNEPATLSDFRPDDDKKSSCSSGDGRSSSSSSIKTHQNRYNQQVIDKAVEQRRSVEAEACSSNLGSASRASSLTSKGLAASPSANAAVVVVIRPEASERRRWQQQQPDRPEIFDKISGYRDAPYAFCCELQQHHRRSCPLQIREIWVRLGSDRKRQQRSSLTTTTTSGPAETGSCSRSSSTEQHRVGHRRATGSQQQIASGRDCAREHKLAGKDKLTLIDGHVYSLAPVCSLVWPSPRLQSEPPTTTADENIKIGHQDVARFCKTNNFGLEAVALALVGNAVACPPAEPVIGLIIISQVNLCDLGGRPKWRPGCFGADGGGRRWRAATDLSNSHHRQCKSGNSSSYLSDRTRLVGGFLGLVVAWLAGERKSAAENEDRKTNQATKRATNLLASWRLLIELLIPNQACSSSFEDVQIRKFHFNTADLQHDQHLSLSAQNNRVQPAKRKLNFQMQQCSVNDSFADSAQSFASCLAAWLELKLAAGSHWPLQNDCLGVVAGLSELLVCSGQQYRPEIGQSVLNASCSKTFPKELVQAAAEGSSTIKVARRPASRPTWTNWSSTLSRPPMFYRHVVVELSSSSPSPHRNLRRQRGYNGLVPANADLMLNQLRDLDERLDTTTKSNQKSSHLDDRPADDDDLLTHNYYSTTGNSTSSPNNATTSSIKIPLCSRISHQFPYRESATVGSGAASGCFKRKDSGGRISLLLLIVLQLGLALLTTCVPKFQQQSNGLFAMVAASNDFRNDAAPAATAREHPQLTRSSWPLSSSSSSLSGDIQQETRARSSLGHLQSAAGQRRLSRAPNNQHQPKLQFDANGEQLSAAAAAPPPNQRNQQQQQQRHHEDLLPVERRASSIGEPTTAIGPAAAVVEPLDWAPPTSQEQNFIAKTSNADFGLGAKQIIDQTMTQQQPTEEASTLLARRMMISSEQQRQQHASNSDVDAKVAKQQRIEADEPSQTTMANMEELANDNPKSSSNGNKPLESSFLPQLYQSSSPSSALTMSNWSSLASLPRLIGSGIVGQLQSSYGNHRYGNRWTQIEPPNGGGGGGAAANLNNRFSGNGAFAGSGTKGNPMHGQQVVRQQQQHQQQQQSPSSSPSVSDILASWSGRPTSPSSSIIDRFVASLFDGSGSFGGGGGGAGIGAGYTNDRRRNEDTRRRAGLLRRTLNRISDRIGARNTIRVHNAFRDFAWRLLASLSMPTPIIYELRRQNFYSPVDDLVNDGLYNRNTSKTIRIGRKFNEFLQTNLDSILNRGRDQNQQHQKISKHSTTSDALNELPAEPRTSSRRRSDESADRKTESDGGQPRYKRQYVEQPDLNFENGPRERLRNRLEDLVRLSRNRPLFGRVIRLPSLFPFRRRKEEMPGYQNAHRRQPLATNVDNNNNNNRNNDNRIVSSGHMMDGGQPVIKPLAYQPYPTTVVRLPPTKTLVDRNRLYSDTIVNTTIQQQKVTRKAEKDSKPLSSGSRLRFFRRRRDRVRKTDPAADHQIINIDGKKFYLDDDNELKPLN